MTSLLDDDDNLGTINNRAKNTYPDRIPTLPEPINEEAPEVELAN